MAWQMPEIGVGSTGLKDKDLRALGIPGEEEYVRLYCKRTGRAGIANRNFYSAYNFFRIAAILQGVAGRVRDGTAASAHAEKAAAAVQPLAALGWEFAQKSTAE
jgi:aminoglycoside phosphotransferase (APT) family kinase protein